MTHPCKYCLADFYSAFSANRHYQACKVKPLFDALQKEYEAKLLLCEEKYKKKLSLQRDKFRKTVNKQSTKVLNNKLDDEVFDDEITFSNETFVRPANFISSFESYDKLNSNHSCDKCIEKIIKFINDYMYNYNKKFENISNYTYTLGIIRSKHRDEFNDIDKICADNILELSDSFYDKLITELPKQKNSKDLENEMNSFINQLFVLS